MIMLEMLYLLALMLVYHLNDDNSKSSFIVLGEEVTFGTRKLWCSRKKFSINFNKANTK